MQMLETTRGLQNHFPQIKHKHTAFNLGFRTVK